MHLNAVDSVQRKRDEIKESPPALTPPPVARRLLLSPFGWELPNVSGCEEDHHRFIALLHGEQLGDLHVSASARSPSRCLPHRFPERCGETAELEGREPTVNTPPHLSRHPKGIREKERFWLEERRKRVKRYDTTRP